MKKVIMFHTPPGFTLAGRVELSPKGIKIIAETGHTTIMKKVIGDLVQCRLKTPRATPQAWFESLPRTFASGELQASIAA